MGKLKKIFNVNIADMSDYYLVFSTVKGIVGYILQYVQIEMTKKQQDQEVWTKKLQASTYLLYVVMYEEFYKFNPKH